MVDDPRESVQSLMERFRAPLQRRIRLMMGPRAREQAESLDFLQQVFVTALENIDHLRQLEEAQQLRWLTATARNRVRRSTRRQRELVLASLAESVSGLLPRAASTEAPCRHVGRQEQVEHLIDVLSTLKEEHQQVIEWRDFDGLSFRDIGERFGRTESAVQMLHARALMKLAEGLQHPSL